MPQAALKKNRPKFLSLTALLFQIRLPLAGWVSILHRASGALLFAAVLWLLFLLDRSLASEQSFAGIQHYASLPLVKIALLVIVWAFCHHLCAGIRFLFLDLHWGVEKAAAWRTSLAVLVASLALTAFFGWKLVW
jgi:succinate dehydrogenase / fumarate reductase cytochrome b subunit